jgi:hypothetical protein
MMGADDHRNRKSVNILLLSVYGHRIEHTITKKDRHYITSCKMQPYISLDCGTYTLVTILTLICSYLTALSRLICTPIFTIESIL